MKRFLQQVVRVLPLIIILIWILAIGFLLWQRVKQSQQPPIYDALSYVEKAKGFWDNAAKGWPKNPLNGVQSSRPPGTVLLSYPFGFNENYKGFLFRSIFVPFLLWLFSILIIAWPAKHSDKSRRYWILLLAVFLLGPMPFFFQFEHPAHAGWGLVDGFLAGLAALAIASAGRSLLYNSWKWLVLAAVAASLSPMVKPSGGLILLLATLFWSGGTLLSIWKTAAENRRRQIRYWLLGTGLFIVLGGGVSWVCLNSDYLGPEAISYSRRMTKLLQSEFGPALSFNFSIRLINSLFGPHFLIVIGLVGYVIAKFPTTHNPIPPWFWWIASGVFCLVGGWFWIIATGFAQVRYFYPFALMIILPPLMLIFPKIYSAPRLSGFTNWLIPIVLATPAINLVCLLLFLNPNNKWQQISGVMMRIDPTNNGVQIAKEFLAETKNSINPLTVYLTNSQPINSNFNCYIYYQKILNPNLTKYNFLRPVDWQRPSTFRLSEILKSDYIAFRPVSIDEQRQVKITEIKTLDQERIVFESFLSTLNPGNGLQTVIDTKFCRLSKITNRSRFKESLGLLLKNKSWRPVFLQANNNQSGEWEPFSKVYPSVPPGYTLSRPISFNASIDVLNGNYPITEKIEASDILTIGGWMAYSAKDGIPADEMFVFLENQQGNIRYYATEQKPRPDVNKGYKHPDMKDVGYRATIALGDLHGDYFLGLAIGYQGKLIPSRRFRLPVKVLNDMQEIPAF